MKTRIIKTSLWRDSLVNPINIDTKLVYLYILTNDRAGLTDYQQVIFPEISLYTGLKTELIELCITQLQERGLLVYANGWIKLTGGAYVNSNYSGKNVEKSREEELSKIPSNIKDLLDVQVPNQVPNQVALNNKSEIINHKSEIKNQKLKNFENKDLPETEANEIIGYYNTIMNTKISSHKGFIKNLKYWLADYTLDEIKQAINNIRTDNFWKDKMDLVILFRKKNPNGEDVDNISKMLNIKKQTTKVYDLTNL